MVATSAREEQGGGMAGTLTTQEILDAGLDDWRLLLGVLHARFETGDFASGLALVNRIGEAAEEADHHPDLDLRWGHLNLKLVSHDSGGVTERDLRMARRISELAAEAGATPRPDRVQALEIALDTPDFEKVKPFWRALLGLEDDPGSADAVRDAGGQLPALWFQDTDPHEAPRMRFHLDITVPHDLAQQRIDAAVEAGGTVVDDSRAPAFVVLADADGNKACVCTCLDRD